MRNRELNRQLQQLRSLITRACSSTVHDLELQAQWARYFTVLAAGFVENAVPLIYEEYLRRAANQRIARFASSHLDRVQNPKAERLVQITRQFDEAWATTLEAFLADGGRKEAIDGIMSTRHQIAHGNNVGITVARITDYLNKAEAVVEFMENQVAPHTPAGSTS